MSDRDQAFEDASPSDTAAFTRAFQAYRAELRAYARQFVLTREAAEDVVQEVFFGAWSRWKDMDLVVNLRGYLYHATRNRALNHIRDQRSWDRRALHHEEPSLVEPEVEALLRSAEIAHAVEQVLRRMPPRRREVVSLRLRGQLSNADIAAKLGISVKGVEIHVTRATRTLREQLPALLGEGGGNG